jgi:uroporphyrinogen-III decarboxylase
LPKGKILGLFDSTDIFKAKEILGNTMCLSGMMPPSLLQTGTPDEVKAYSKKLIDVCGKNGGFVMGPRSVMDEANPELVKVWFNYTKEYGVYN